MFDTKEEIYYSVVLLFLFALVLITIIIVTAILYYNRKKMQQKERDKFQKELLRTQLEIKEQTLKNVSQEIHDNIGQTLSLARMTLNIMAMEQDGNPEKINQSQALVGKAIQDLRDLSKTLNADMLLFSGLLPALEAELKAIEKTGVFDTELFIEGQAFKMDPQKELILYRIVQEALQNILKHAEASQIKITALFNPKSFNLEIHDNGRGFNTDTVLSENRGSGLLNMKNRAQLIGGLFLCQSGITDGTTINITLPN